MAKTKWMTTADFDEPVHGLLGIYDRHVDALHHTSNVVRMARVWPRPILYVQRNGRLTKHILRDLHTAQGMKIIDPRLSYNTVVNSHGNAKSPGIRCSLPCRSMGRCVRVQCKA